MKLKKNIEAKYPDFFTPLDEEEAEIMEAREKG